MPPLFLGKVAEQLAETGVIRLSRGLRVEAFRLQLHLGDRFADCVQPERPHEPSWAPLDKALYIFAANARDVLAKTCPVLFDQSVAIAVLFGPHLLEHFCRVG